MKKHTLRILTFLLAVCLLGMTAFAAEEWGSLNLSADSAEVALGERITLTLSLGDCSALEGGVKNFKAVITVPEGLRVVSAEINPDFETATGISSPSCNIREGQRIIISALGNVGGSYTGGEVTIASVACVAEYDGVYNVEFEAGLTDSDFATRAPAVSGVRIIAGTGAAEETETSEVTKAAEATEASAPMAETARGTETAAETALETMQPDEAAAAETADGGMEIKASASASESAITSRNGGSPYLWVIAAVMLCAAVLAIVIIRRGKRK